MPQIQISENISFHMFSFSFSFFLSCSLKAFALLEIKTQQILLTLESSEEGFQLIQCLKWDQGQLAKIMLSLVWILPPTALCLQTLSFPTVSPLLSRLSCLGRSEQQECELKGPGSLHAGSQSPRGLSYSQPRWAKSTGTSETLRGRVAYVAAGAWLPASSCTVWSPWCRPAAAHPGGEPHLPGGLTSPAANLLPSSRLVLSWPLAPREFCCGICFLYWAVSSQREGRGLLFTVRSPPV